MTAWVALLRAVNVGGTGKLPMEMLRTMASELGLGAVRTHIASGNLLFHSELSETELTAMLETRLHAFAGKPVSVFLRTASQLAEICAADPFPDAHGSRQLVYFRRTPFPADYLAGVRDQQGEQLALSGSHLYVDYGDGIRHTRLKLPDTPLHTARNINTVRRLAEMLRA